MPRDDRIYTKFSSAFKARVAIEALKERQTLAELSQKFEVSQEVISRWKGEFLKLSSGVFDKKQSRDDCAPTEEVRSLRAKVGELTMERDFFVDACRRSGLKVK